MVNEHAQRSIPHLPLLLLAGRLLPRGPRVQKRRGRRAQIPKQVDDVPQVAAQLLRPRREALLLRR